MAKVQDPACLGMLRTSREVIGIWSTSRAPSRRAVAKATGFPDEVAQVDDRLGTCTALAIASSSSRALKNN